MKKLVIYTLIITCFMSCTTFYSAVDRGGDNIIEDTVLVLEKALEPLQVNFSLTNKSDTNIEILWEKCNYTDFSGKAYKVFCSGTKFKEDGTINIPATIIAPGKTYSDFIAPVDALKNREQLHNYKTEMYATHPQTMNQIYIVGKDIDYTKKKELEGFIGREYTIHLVILAGLEEVTYNAKGKITEVIDLSKE
ncbi:MAG: hypothetical protein JXB88_18810 [Spirochaetales bacterium]|nr:hypothetical protein [Spirochaetales bacterium]